MPEATAAPRSVSVGKTAAFGLLFPGAAQAYAGRWGLAVAFVLMPWILMTFGLLLSILTGLCSVAFPRTQDASVWVVSFIVGLGKPNGMIYPVLWVLSIFEGVRWARAEQERPSGRTTNWVRPVVGLVAIFLLAIPLFFLQLYITKLALTAGLAAKSGFKTMLGRP